MTQTFITAVVHVAPTNGNNVVVGDGPGVDVPFGALALDGTGTPTTIYVGTDLGVLRSVDRGATWYVLDDIHFPSAPVTDLVICRRAPEAPSHGIPPAYGQLAAEVLGRKRTPGHPP